MYPLDSPTRREYSNGHSCGHKNAASIRHGDSPYRQTRLPISCWIPETYSIISPPHPHIPHSEQTRIRRTFTTSPERRWADTRIQRHKYLTNTAGKEKERPSRKCWKHHVRCIDSHVARWWDWPGYEGLGPRCMDVGGSSGSHRQ